MITLNRHKMWKTIKIQWDYGWSFTRADSGKSHYSKMNKLLLLLLTLSLSSCFTSKNIDYLQSQENILNLKVRPTEYRVQPNDILNVSVQSRDPEQSAFFNLRTIDDTRTQANPASLFLTGHTVNQEGMINLAIVGKLKVSNLSVEEIRNLVQVEIDKYLLNAIVSVKLTSFKISVLGDVKNPGTNYVYNTQSTIFEALSAAGDLNLTAKRKNVKLIRQNGDKSIVVNLDLTNPSIIQSPYYFLHPNDVIYVETSKQNLANNNVRNNLGIFSLILSAISTTILVLSFTTN